MNLLNIISSCQLLPLATLTSKEQVEPLCKALIKAGLPLIEITLRDERTINILDEFKKYPQIAFGVGTIRTTHQRHSTPEGRMPAASGFSRGGRCHSRRSADASPG